MTNSPAVSEGLNDAMEALDLDTAAKLPVAIVEAFCVHTTPPAVRAALEDLIAASKVGPFVSLLRAVSGSA